jgi:hypothetical protein
MRNGSTMNVYQKFAALFALLLLLSTFVAVSHHHESTTDDHDCPVCIAGQHHSAASPSIAAFDGIPFFTETTVAVSVPALAGTSFIFSHSSRGPPA